MCLIVLVNDKKSFNKNDLKTAYKRNQNGMGVMYVNKNNEFVSDKFLPKNENEVINFTIYTQVIQIRLLFIYDLLQRERQIKKIATHLLVIKKIIIL